jgi:hypothetical protein
VPGDVTPGNTLWAAIVATGALLLVLGGLLLRRSVKGATGA